MNNIYTSLGLVLWNTVYNLYYLVKVTARTSKHSTDCLKTFLSFPEVTFTGWLSLQTLIQQRQCQ